MTNHLLRRTQISQFPCKSSHVASCRQGIDTSAMVAGTTDQVSPVAKRDAFVSFHEESTGSEPCLSLTDATSRLWLGMTDDFMSEQELDEVARAVRKRFHEQMNDAVHDGTFEDSDADIPFAFPWAGQDQKRCEHCGKKGKFKCSRCNFTYYCSESLQPAHHAQHQKVCEQLDGVKLTRQLEEMLRWVGPVDSDDECAGDPSKTSAFDLCCLLAAGEKFGQPGSFEDDDDDDDDDDPFGFGIDPFDEDMIRSTFGMSGFEFRSLNGGLYTMDQRYQDAMNAIDFCPDADDPRFW